MKTLTEYVNEVIKASKGGSDDIHFDLKLNENCEVDERGLQKVTFTISKRISIVEIENKK